MEARREERRNSPSSKFRKRNRRDSQSSCIDTERVAEHWRNNSWRQDFVLNEREYQFILGTLLGDTSIGFPNKRSRSPRLAFNHSTKQIEWAIHKARKLRRLQPRVRIVENPGYGRELVRVVTSCLPALRAINDLVRPAGRKTVTSAWLNALRARAIAWWYCDDGSFQYDRRVSCFHTEGFGLQGSELVREWFESRYGGAYKYHHKKRHWQVRLSVDGTKRMLREIRPYVPPVMRYKLGDCRKEISLFR